MEPGVRFCKTDSRYWDLRVEMLMTFLQSSAMKLMKSNTISTSGTKIAKLMMNFLYSYLP
jgi:hypothetical protein